MKAETLTRIYSSHQGVEKSRLRARTYVYLPGINEDVEDLVRECELCEACQQHMRTNTKETLIPQEIPTGPWETLGIDLFHCEGQNYLIVADFYSKFFMTRKTEGQCTSQAVVQLTKQLFAEHRIPKRVINHNGRQ